MRRFFTEPQNIDGASACIFEDAKHIEKVLRMKCGDEILIFDGSGYEYRARLTDIQRDFCRALILEKALSLSEPQTEITLFQGLPKAGKTELIVQKAVELGVTRIVPVVTERSVIRLSSSEAGLEKAKRWNKVSLEAAKQCGRGRVPAVSTPIGFEAAVDELCGLELAIMPYELLGHEGRCDLKAVLNEFRAATRIGLLIGPEGGFSDKEAEYAMARGVHAVGLGKRILRTETVASALIPVIMFDRGEF